MPWYRTGTVAVTLNSNTVTGTGTSFVGNTRVGDAFIGPDGGWYEVINVASNTVLGISPDYRGATAAAGTYSIVPVQGYTRDLADQAKKMLNDWGSTLASLGTVSTENIVPVAKGGTGSTTALAARSALGLGSAAVADVVGLSSAGAIIERGSNASGKYIKFADGTLICYRNRIAFAATANTTASLNSGFAALFSEVPLVMPVLEYPATNDNINVLRFSSVATVNGSCTIQLKADITQTYMVGFCAIGRWF